MGRRKDVFLLNLWREGEDSERARIADWRASIEHVQTRRRLYFTELIDLVTFLAGYTKPDNIEDRDRRA